MMVSTWNYALLVVPSKDENKKERKRERERERERELQRKWSTLVMKKREEWKWKE